MKDVFPMVPAPGTTLWFVAALSVLMALLLGLFYWIGWATQHTDFEVSADKLTIRGDMYGRSIPRSDLLVDHARIVNLNVDRQYRLKLRTNGCGLPANASGWFRLTNGEKALAFITSGERVVYLPTTKGYSLLVSPKEPQRLLDALNAGR